MCKIKFSLNFFYINTIISLANAFNAFCFQQKLAHMLFSSDLFHGTFWDWNAHRSMIYSWMKFPKKKKRNINHEKQSSSFFKFCSFLFKNIGKHILDLSWKPSLCQWNKIHFIIKILVKIFNIFEWSWKAFMTWDFSFSEHSRFRKYFKIFTDLACTVKY